MKTIAKIRLFFINLKIIFEGGLVKTEVWKQKQALEEIIKD